MLLVAHPGNRYFGTSCNQRKLFDLDSIWSRQRMSKSRNQTFEYVEPLGARVLVRKDEPKRETKGGIALPDQSEIPTITGRIVTISAQIKNNEDIPLRQYDKVLFHPKNAIPVDFESDNQLFVVPVEDVVAVFRREAPE
jgi:chaperonin GroES